MILSVVDMGMCWTTPPLSLSFNGNVPNYVYDLEGTTELRLRVHENLFICMCKHATLQTCMNVCVCVCVSVWNYAAHVRHYVNILQPQVIRNPGFCTPQPWYKLLLFLYDSSLSSAYEVIQHVPLSFALPLLCCAVSLHASMSAALPTGVWFMNSILVCHYCLQKGALMGQYVDSRRIASCPQTSWIFFWQPVARSISDLDNTRWCIKIIQEISAYFIL